MFGFSLISYVIKLTARNITNSGYDTVIAFSEGIVSRIVSYVNNNNKVAWVRCDYSRYLSINSYEPELDIYHSFAHIICVSEYTAQIFRQIIPEVAEKVMAVHNVIDFDSINKSSKAETILDKRFYKDNFTILSIGRIDPVKRFFDIPRIAQIIKKQKVNFKWFIIGAGSPVETHKLLSNIKTFNVYIKN